MLITNMRTVHYILLALLAIKSNTALAQFPAPQDTSFTVNSAYQKERKKHPDIRVASPPKPANIQVKANQTYVTYGNRHRQLDLFYPQGKKKQKYPVVLLIHGGGWRSGNRHMEAPLAQQIAARGYVTAVVEYRLSTEALYPAAVHDIKAAVRWVRNQAGNLPVDTTRIAVMGFSAGGQLAALAGTTNDTPRFEGQVASNTATSRVQAIINVDGILAFIHPESQESTAAALWLGGSAAEKPDLWHEAAPLTHVHKNTPPIIFINSAIPRFHAGREDMKVKLDELGIYHETYTLPGTPHPFWLFDPWFEQVLSLSTAFLDKVFKK